MSLLKSEERSKVTRSLADPDAVGIFLEARTGVKFSKEMAKRLGISRKQFVEKMAELEDVGLVAKRGSFYYQSTLGEKISAMLFDPDTRQEALEFLEKNGIVAKGEIERIRGSPHFFFVVKDLDELFSMAAGLIEDAAEEMLLSTDYVNAKVAEAAFEAADRGVKIYAIDGGQKDVSHRLRLAESIISDTRAFKVLMEFLRSPQVSIRSYRVPWSMLLIDGKCGLVVLPGTKQNGPTSFFFLDEAIYQRLKGIFFDWWSVAEEHPGLKVVEKVWNKSRYVRSLLNSILESSSS